MVLAGRRKPKWLTVESTATRKRTTDTTTLFFTIGKERLSTAFPTSASVTATPSGLTVGTPALLANGVVADVSSGTDGGTYTVTATITLSDTRVLTEVQQLVVSNPTLASDTTLLLQEPEYVFTNLVSAVGLLGEYGTRLRLDDDQSAMASPTERRFLLDYAKVATAKVKRKCIAYEASQLALSWSVWNWTTVIYVRWIATRRGNPLPPGFQEMYLETMDELEMVKKGQEFIEDINIAIDPSPSWSNLRIDHFYVNGQQRVNKATSDLSPTGRRRRYESGSYFLREVNW